MLNDRRRLIASPFDAEKLVLVRDFLRREFRDCLHRDYFAFDQTAQVFVIETEHGSRHRLVIPEATFDDPGFSRLCDVQLADMLRLAEGCVTLTPHGPEARV
jgi:hypothetical protein